MPSQLPSHRLLYLSKLPLRCDIASPAPKFDQIVAHIKLDLVSSAALRQMADATYDVPNWWRGVWQDRSGSTRGSIGSLGKTYAVSLAVSGISGLKTRIESRKYTLYCYMVGVSNFQSFV